MQGFQPLISIPHGRVKRMSSLLYTVICSTRLPHRASSNSAMFSGAAPCILRSFPSEAYLLQMMCMSFQSLQYSCSFPSQPVSVIFVCGGPHSIPQSILLFIFLRFRSTSPSKQFQKPQVQGFASLLPQVFHSLYLFRIANHCGKLIVFADFLDQQRF